jgi:hypothetical protein
MLSRVGRCAAPARWRRRPGLVAVTPWRPRGLASVDAPESCDDPSGVMSQQD